MREDSDSAPARYRLDDGLAAAEWCSRHCSTLDRLCVEKDTDDHRPRFNRIVPCVDLDSYERDRADRNGSLRQPTMDAVLCIRSTADAQPSHPEALLVELRFNYTGTRNLRAENMDGKILHSKEILSANGVAAHRYSFFVFEDDVASLAYSWFHRWRRGSTCPNLSSAVPVGTKALLDYVGINTPFVPKNSPEAIARELKDGYARGGIGRLREVFHRFVSEALPYRYRFELQECESVYSALAVALSALLAAAAAEEDAEAIEGLIGQTRRELAFIRPTDAASAVERDFVQ